MMITCVTWLWSRPNGPAFSALYVNRLHSMLERHLHVPHELVLVTDRPRAMIEDLNLAIRVVPMPLDHVHTPRCQRRMWQYAKERRYDLGPRIMALDLDIVITGNITPLATRLEPIVCWRVGYAGVFSGSIVLYDAGALDGAWQAFRDDPVGFPEATGERNASDQAMLNHWLKTTKTRPAYWTERDGLITWFGKGYERLEHHGMGPNRPQLKPTTRMVVLGSADKDVMDEGRYAFVRDHWH